MSSTRIPELMAANAKFAESYTAPVTMKQIRPSIKEAVLVCELSLPCVRVRTAFGESNWLTGLFQVTCMDPRVVPEQFLGPKAQLAVFRNAGGRATPDVVRTITVLQSLGFQAEQATVLVIHHTGEDIPETASVVLS